MGLPDYKVGDYLVITNAYNRKLEGNLVKKYGMKWTLVDEDNDELEVFLDGNEKFEVIASKFLDKNKAKDKAKIGRLRNLQWKGQSLGSDPEFFLVDSKTDEVISAFDFLPDAKNSHGVPFWDGFQAEFNIDAGSCLDQRVGSMQQKLRDLHKRARLFNKRADFTIKSTVEISEEVFNKASPKHIEFGCSPSINVYGSKGLELNGSETRIRNAGGHIHFGLTESQKKKVPEYVKMLDRVLGVACVAMFANFDNPLRRQYYGLAGEYRTPKHGLEYRTLTNAWACDPRMMYIVFELARKCIAMVDEGLTDLWDTTDEETIECINNCDVNMAKNTLLINREVFEAMLSSMSYNREGTVNVIFNTVMQGMEVLIEKPNNIFGNWFGDYFNKQIRNIENEDNLIHLKKRLEYK